jgi:hypothetical protein
LDFDKVGILEKQESKDSRAGSYEFADVLDENSMPSIEQVVA